MILSLPIFSERVEEHRLLLLLSSFSDNSVLLFHCSSLFSVLRAAQASAAHPRQKKRQRFSFPGRFIGKILSVYCRTSPAIRQTTKRFINVMLPMAKSALPHTACGAIIVPAKVQPQKSKIYPTRTKRLPGRRYSIHSSP